MRFAFTDDQLAFRDAARDLLEKECPPHAVRAERAALAAAAQLVGLAQQMIDMSVAYASQRQQFGKPVGSFQAVKHHLADAALRLEFARPCVYRTAWTLARGITGDDRMVHVSLAK